VLFSVVSFLQFLYLLWPMQAENFVISIRPVSQERLDNNIAWEIERVGEEYVHYRFPSDNAQDYISLGVRADINNRTIWGSSVSSVHFTSSFEIDERLRLQDHDFMGLDGGQGWLRPGMTRDVNLGFNFMYIGDLDCVEDFIRSHGFQIATNNLVRESRSLDFTQMLRLYKWAILDLTDATFTYHEGY